MKATLESGAVFTKCVDKAWKSDIKDSLLEKVEKIKNVLEYDDNLERFVDSDEQSADTLIYF